MGIAAEIGNRQQVDHLFQRVLSEYGRVDILVNNAGVHRAVPFMELTEEEWDRVLQTNLKGTFYCLKAAIPSMVQQKRGVIINVASVAVKNGRQASVHHYIASKSAIVGLTLSLSAEFAPQGLRVNCVCPGIIDTDMGAVSRRSSSRSSPCAGWAFRTRWQRPSCFSPRQEPVISRGEVTDVNGGLFMD